MKKIDSLMVELYEEILSELKSIVSKASEGEVKVKFLHRYIDGDGEQDITRVKRVFITDDGHCCFVGDSWNGEDYAADVFFDYDDCFEDEETYDLDEMVICTDNISFIKELYDDVFFYSEG